MKHKILILSVLIAGFAFGQSTQQQKLMMAEYAIKSFYVDTIGEERLVESAILGMLEKLDPHSAYLNPQEVKEADEPLVGNFDGIGVQFQMLKDTLYVVETVVGGPSESIGIRAGDRIIAVNDTSIAGVKMTTKQIMSRLRGPRGTYVKVAVKRAGTVQPLVFNIRRDKIPIESIYTYYMLDDEIGYVKVARFAAQTPKEFQSAIESLQKQGMKNLIIDLQGNGGGYLGSAIDMANQLLSPGQLIVYTEGKSSPRSDAKVPLISNGIMREGKIAILVDQYSASASEIVSGAVQDWDRGVVVGRRTFGKGLVQRPFNLPDGSVIRLTTSRYYTPAGRCVQSPYDEGKEAYNKGVLKRFEHGEWFHADSIQFPDSLRYKTLKNKRVVYGGGGIMPDIFVPADTSLWTPYFRSLLNKDLISNFANDYSSLRRDELRKQYPNLSDFMKKPLDNSVFDQFFALAEKEGVKRNEEEIKTSRPLIEYYLKAIIGRHVFNMEAYYRLINTENEALTKALELLKDEQQYRRILGYEQSSAPLHPSKKSTKK